MTGVQSQLWHQRCTYEVLRPARVHSYLLVFAPASPGPRSES
jgi:hypothetical protein